MSCNSPENGNLLRGVQHGHFRVGVVDRVTNSIFFQQGVRTLEKKTKLVRMIILVGLENTKMLIWPIFNEVIA